MSEYLIPVIIESLEEGGYLATSHVLRGLIAQGRTVAETLEIAEDVARKIIESCIEHGDQLPEKLNITVNRSVKLEAQIPVQVEL